MMPSSSRRELFERLRYTFITADYQEIDVLIDGLVRKGNFESLCDEFFHGCRINTRGYLEPTGFFHDDAGSASLLYAMYEILGRTPDTFILKHRVTRAKFLRKNLSGSFRLPRGLFSLPRLEALIVRGIGISRLPDETGTARTLRILDLSGNRIADFPEVVLKLSRLAALNLSHNVLTELPVGGLGRLKRLRVLNLRGNHLVALPEDWHRLQELRTLDLSMNRLESLPDSLRTPVSLKDLRLAYNNLSAAEEARWEKEAREHSPGGQGSLGIG